VIFELAHPAKPTTTPNSWPKTTSGATAGAFGLARRVAEAELGLPLADL
jgi:hypothetical protein